MVNSSHDFTVWRVDWLPMKVIALHTSMLRIRMEGWEFWCQVGTYVFLDTTQVSFPYKQYLLEGDEKKYSSELQNLYTSADIYRVLKD